MSEENKEIAEIEIYGDSGIVSHNNPVPNWLLLTYLALPIWGIVILYIFFNGSIGVFDRGYWGPLQQAANTTFPLHNANLEELKPIHKERVSIINEGSQKMAEVMQGHKLELQEERLSNQL